jgi:hypothetical protein
MRKSNDDELWATIDVMQQHARSMDGLLWAIYQVFAKMRRTSSSEICGVLDLLAASFKDHASLTRRLRREMPTSDDLGGARFVRAVTRIKRSIEGQHEKRRTSIYRRIR